MSRNVFLDEAKQGDILYLADRQSYGESEKNKVFVNQLPDYVVIDQVCIGENGWQIDIAGFPLKAGAILMIEGDTDSFTHVAHIDDYGCFDMDDIRENPYTFSNYYKVGGHLRHENETVLYLDGLLSGMTAFNINKPGNKDELTRLMQNYIKNGTLLPSQMAYIANRLIKGLHETAIRHHEGDTKEAHKTLHKILMEKSNAMDTPPK